MTEFGTSATADLTSAFTDMMRSAGGVDLARRAEDTPAVREELATVLSTFGAWDIDPYADEEQATFAAAVCHRAGLLNLPYPIADRMTAHGLDGIDACCVLNSTSPLVGHGDLGLRWAGVRDGALWSLRETGSDQARTRIAPFASEVVVGDVLPSTSAARRETASLLLSGFVLLGMCDAAARDTYDYVGTRRQFGSPVGSFQGLRFSLTDVATVLQGAHELGLYALWSFAHSRAEALADALSFRIAVLEAADTTFSRTHQAHGAIGLCDETDLSWLSRHSRVLRHAPWGITRSERRLFEVSGTASVVGPFSA